MRTFKQKCNSLWISWNDSQFDDSECNLDDEVLSEGVKAHIPLWFNNSENNDFSIPFLEANEFHEKSGSQSEVKDNTFFKTKDLYLNKSKNDNT